MLNSWAMTLLWRIECLGSFSAVAQELGWSQPAISRQIAKLEQECGMPLVQRSSHGVALTDGGRIIAHHGELIANRILQAQKELDEYASHHGTRLKLLAPPSICSTIAARALIRMSRTSDLEVSLEQAEPSEAMDSVSNGDADCALVFSYGSIPQYLVLNDDLSAQVLGRDPMQLMVCACDEIAQRYLADGVPVHLSALHDRSWIAGCQMCQENLVALARNAGFIPHIIHATEDYGATQNLVEMGLGISLVSKLSTKEYLREDLVICPVCDDMAFRSIQFVSRKGDDRLMLQNVQHVIEEVSRPLLIAA